MQELGQIKIGPIELVGPVKARITGNFLPSFTIDLAKPPPVGILSLIQPKITFLVGNKAYEIGWAEKRIKEVNPRIFESDTWLDTIQKIGVIPVVLFIGGLIYLGYRVLLKIKE